MTSSYWLAEDRPRLDVPRLDGHVDVATTFGVDKVTRQRRGVAMGQRVSGYEIHHGYVASNKADPLIEPGEGARYGNVFGTHWHGTFESDSYRRAFLTEAARLAGRDGFEGAPDTCFAQRREDLLDLLGDLVAEHLDTEALTRLIETGPPAGLPFLPPGAPVLPPEAPGPPSGAAG